MNPVATETKLELGKVIREAIVESASPDPSDIAQVVYDRIDPVHYPDLLPRLLRESVRDVIRQQRHEARRGGGVSRSAAWDEVRAMDGQGVFREIVCVKGQYLYLGELTRVQVAQLAEEHITRATFEQNVADRYAQLAATMAKKRKGRVSDLPERLVDEIINGE